VESRPYVQDFSPIRGADAVSQALPKSHAESDAERGIRDLMGLLALTSLWVEKDGNTILQLMTEAVERILPLRFSYADVVLLPEQGPVTAIRVDGVIPVDAAAAEWRACAAGWPKTPAMNARAHDCATPLGTLRLLCFRLGYGSAEGHIWFGSDNAGFPSATQLAVMRAATSLAASGFQSARAKHEREEANRAKDEFLAMLGHELRNPLAPIAVAAEILRAGKLDEARIRRTSEVISRQVSHMTGLVDDLLDVSRVSGGRVTIEKLRVDMNNVVADAVEQAMPLLEERRHRFSADVPAGAIEVLGDQKRLVQVVANLLNNAAKYTPPGGNIHLRMQAQHGRVAVSVSDNGIGIGPKLISSVFDLFTQGNRTSDRAQGGLGLGLALVKSLVELHGGSVSARSEGQGKGSEFSFELPCLPADSPFVPVSATEVHRLCPPPGNGLAAPSAAAGASHGGLRILIVDDNVDAAETLEMLLATGGHAVRRVHHPADALALVEQELAAFDVYLLDLGLPDIDGRALAARLKKSPHAAGAVYIAVTGYGQEEDRRQSLASGFAHHVVKPVDGLRLLGLLDTLAPAHSR
jgi:signal transduction histidine kinase